MSQTATIAPTTTAPVAPAWPGVDLKVNDGPLPASEVLPLQPSYPSKPLSVLRERYERDGVLFLKGLLPRDDVLRCREAYFNYLSPTGVLAPGSAAVDGIFYATKDRNMYPGVGAATNPGKKTDDTAATFVDLAIKAHTEPWYAEDLCKHPVLLDFIKKFSGWGEDTLALRRTLLRNNTPGNKAIGVHYDQIFLRYGEPTAITGWVPIGDVSLEGGGLIYMEDGDKIGQQIENEFTERAKKAGLTDDEAKNGFNRNMMTTGWLGDGPLEFGREYGKRWYVSAYEAGDVTLHKPHMIHASTINEDPLNRIRLATDLRWVNSAREHDKRWMEHYRPDDGL
ncbi:putative phytanoyl- dioxygenase protein [Lasiodiplodia theobromae]|uniref:Phytanoyl- dioxygenase protein n=1 Tax=Lasiodiplodia theobromae TaxID=45133 RepID=A0A8H7IPT0_9PEZI|nr:putative phytanoyl- dioxygenase protein [Lasiodiplodia theobromae]